MPRLADFPIGSHIFDLLLVVEVGIIVLANAAKALPQAKMLRVDGDTMVVLLAAGANELPATLLLLEVQVGGIGEEEDGEDDAGEAEPGDDVECLLGVDVVVQDGGAAAVRAPSLPTAAEKPWAVARMGVG